MDDNKEQEEVGATTEQHPPVEQSPSEKLEDNKPLAANVPGAQTTESKEIKKEMNLNTE